MVSYRGGGGGWWRLLVVEGRDGHDFGGGATVFNLCARPSKAMHAARSRDQTSELILVTSSLPPPPQVGCVDRRMLTSSVVAGLTAGGRAAVMSAGPLDGCLSSALASCLSRSRGLHAIARG